VALSPLVNTAKGFIVRIVNLLTCCCFWIMLTMLLLVPDPAALVHLQRVPVFPWGKFGIHLIAFTILSVWVHATRWPKRLWWPLVAFLVAYGFTTESLQLFVPKRTARVMDGIENILGIAAGAGIYWLLLRLMQPFPKLDHAANVMKHDAETDATEGRPG
jgi:hypothetical protein